MNKWKLCRFERNARRPCRCEMVFVLVATCMRRSARSSHSRTSACDLFRQGVLFCIHFGWIEFKCADVGRYQTHSLRNSINGVACDYDTCNVTFSSHFKSNSDAMTIRITLICFHKTIHFPFDARRKTKHNFTRKMCVARVFRANQLIWNDNTRETRHEYRQFFLFLNWWYFLAENNRQAETCSLNWKCRLHCKLQFVRRWLSS